MSASIHYPVSMSAKCLVSCTGGWSISLDGMEVRLPGHLPEIIESSTREKPSIDVPKKNAGRLDFGRVQGI